ncbi:MAG: NADH-quinone oxidoreductase subunit J [Desulfobacterales bacterium]|nr:NADH-quinone oxidoreductase subunit J [Desulfobacterales bacterium]
MTIYSAIFYLLAALIIATTALAITRRNLVHAVVYLVISFFGSALLFFLLGAPFLAALEVIIYAGAIMVLFLFIVMMLRIEESKRRIFPLSQWIPAAVLCVIYLGMLAVILSGIEGDMRLETAVAVPAAFSMWIFRHGWLAVEIASLILLVALIGALHIGRRPAAADKKEAQ